MTSFLLINLLAILFLTKKIASKYMIIILGALSVIAVLAFSENPFKLGLISEAPVEILLFYAVAIIELVKGKTKNTALIILLSLLTLLQKSDYLYLVQILLYVFLTLKEPIKGFASKCKLLAFLAIWPTSVVIQNLYPSSQLMTLLPIIMSYLVLLKGQENKKTSNELMFAIAISQIYFLKLSSDLVTSDNYAVWVFSLLTLAALINNKLNQYVYPFVVIIPIILFPSLSIFVLSMLFSIKVISNNDTNKTIELHNISSIDVLKVLMIFTIVTATLLNFNQFSLILFVFVTYVLNSQRSLVAFVSDKKEDYRHLIALALLLCLSIGKLTL